MSIPRKPPYTPPTAAVIAEAKRLMREDTRGLPELSVAFTAHFSARAPLHHFEILPQSDVSYRAYIFLARDADIEPCKAGPLAQEMADFIARKLSELGHKTDLALVIESQESVQRDFNGSYAKRLRA